ncbi:nucleotidyl transferase AbiEii/AbiGii toxin family protein [Candidatus Poribacteria bacterium]|nr:nucleotidyl transferase AbiEii/AbiGii toxin family protein [Candidatus Poribacteria bacterium]
MADQFTDFIQVLDAFNKHGVDYILIGGVAVVLHGMERLTRDIDIFVKIVPENIDQLRKALHAVFDDTSIEEITLSELNQYSVIRYGTPSGFYIDIMARLGEVATFDDLEYEIINYEGTQIKIATPETLYQLKKDTIRDKDKMDAIFLKALIQARESNPPRQK